MSAYDQFLKETGGKVPQANAPVDSSVSEAPAVQATEVKPAGGSAYERFQMETSGAPADRAVTIPVEKPEIKSGDAGIVATLKNLPKAWQEETIRLASNLNTGFLKSVSSLVRGFEWAGIDSAKPIADKISQWGDMMQEGRIDGRVDQTFVDALQQGGGSAVTFFIPSVGVMKGASVISKVSPRVAMLFGGSTMAGLESMAEAGDAYETALTAGEDTSSARKKGTAVFGVNMILNSAMNRLGIFNPETKSALKRALFSAPPEAIQEAVQAITQNVTAGRDAMEGVLESGAIGGILGMVMGGGVDVITNKKDTVRLPADGEPPQSAYERFLSEDSNTAQDIANAIKQVESGGNYDAKGASGESGAYQFMPATWKDWSKKYLKNANAPMTPENQDKVALARINELLKQGRSPRDIALIWNGGEPKMKKGVNSKGVSYDSGAYAEKVLAELGNQSSSRAQLPPSQEGTETPAIDLNRPASEIQKEIEGTPAEKKVETPQVNLSEGVDEVIKAGQEELAKLQKDLEAKKEQQKTDSKNESLSGEIKAIDERIVELQKTINEKKQETPVPAVRVRDRLDKDGQDFDKKELKKAGFGVEAMGFGESAEVYSIDGKPAIALSWMDEGLGGFSVAKSFRKQGIATDFLRSLAEDNNGELRVVDPNEDMLKVLSKLGTVSKPDGVGTVTLKLKKEKKTQKEIVEEAVAKESKTIKQVAEETGIKEPNIRRILGEGAKEGVFERVDKGVYILNNGKEDVAFIHAGDAVETLPKLAKEGLKVDMVFLDIPYNTPAVKGGSRGVKYDLVSVEDFRTVMNAVSEIVKTEETPVYYMFSQAESGLKQMMKYNDVLTETGFKAVAKGDWQKMFENGKPVTNVRGKVARPEGILLLNKKGEFIEKDAERNLDFVLRRPKGYQTEKPAELLKSLILQGTKKGDTVLDPFAGSGVTGAEAVKTGRKAVLVEKNEEVAEKVTKPRVAEAIEASRPSPKPLTGSSGNASVGRFRDDTDVEISNPENLKSIKFPELVALAKELTGNDPFIKKYTRANGMFYGKNGGEIGLNPELFKEGNLGQLTKTMAHEIGHLVDYLPNETLTRGNLMGRLNTLSNFREEFFLPAGASRSDAELREQMWELSKYWRPIDEATATDSYIKYRKSSKEIYADFISVLFNDPRKASEVAPTAYNIFFQQLDKKPEVKKAYFELQELLINGNLTGVRRDRVKEMFKVTEQEARERQLQNEIDEAQRERSIWFKFKTQYVDITEAVREKVKQDQKDGKYINPDDNPTFYLNERNYLGGKIKTEIDTKFNTIYQELQKDDMSWEDLGELMFYERILKGDRKEIANPLGFQPDFVQELYDQVGKVEANQAEGEKGASDMRSTLGEAKFEKLQYLAVEYRKNLKQLFVQGREEGLYSPEIEKLFEENAYYVPFKGAKYSGTKSSFAVKSQKGTLGAVENPANSGIEKGVSIIKAIERNKVARKTIEYWQEFHPDELFEAKLDANGYPMKPVEKHLGLVTYMKDGKVKGFYVDKYVADAIQKNTIQAQNLAISGLRFMNSRLFRPLFITFNLGFQSFNFVRDFKRFWKNVPDMTLLKAMRLYGRSVRGAKIRAFGLPANPSEADLEAYEMITRLENEQLLAITFNDIIKGEDIEEAQIDRILRETGVRPSDPKRLGELASKVGITRDTAGVKQAIGILGWIENMGNMIESLPKIAGTYALEGKIPPREMRDFVRKYVGSPDFLAGGQFKPYANEIFLFSNAIFQGIRADYEIATRPASRGAYWMKTVQSEVLPKLLMIMATAGLFGDELKKLFANVSEYDKSNYIIVPMGYDENGKTVYFRIPSDESGRLIGGLFWKIASATKDPEKLGDLETYTNLLSYAGGQVPSISPTISTTFNIGTFLAGNNPYDFFRARPVLTDDQMRAGGAEKVKPFLAYIFQQMGGNVFTKLYYNETVPKNPSLSEKIVGLPVVSNVLGRFLRVSDYGQKETLFKITDEVKTENARENIANRRVVFDYVDQAEGKSDGEVRQMKREMILEIFDGKMPTTPEDRTKARNLEKRFDTLRLRGSADAKVDTIITAQSNEEKVALLVEFKKTMSATEFAELQKFLIQNRVVSSDVIRRFKMSNNPQ